MKLRENPFGGSRVVRCRQTNRQDADNRRFFATFHLKIMHLVI